jgi:hypothetical protein
MTELCVARERYAGLIERYRQQTAAAEQATG